MKRFAAIGATFLLLLVAASVLQLKAQEREDDRNGAKSAKQQDERKPQEEKQNKNQADQEPKAATPDHERHAQGAERSDQERTRPQETTRPQQGQREPAQTQRDQQHPVQAQRGKRVPEDKFRASFGSSHRFHVQRAQIVNNPQPVIVYSGYSFQLLEPWPSEWSFDDDCYIDYVDDQYYLFDPFHPGFRIALIVVGY